MDDRKRVQWGSGLKKARDFQLELTRGKRAQGKTYVDPKAGDELFGTAAEAFIMPSPVLRASDETRTSYLCTYRANIKGRFASRTLGQMCTRQAADEVAVLLNVTLAGKSMGTRCLVRLIITGTMDAAVKADKVGRHKLAGITLTGGTGPAPDDGDEDEEPGGFVFITDAQVDMLAAGIIVRGASGWLRAMKGVGIAAWLQRTMGLRIR